MSYGIAVKALDRAGGPHRAGGQDFFAVDGAPVVVLGDSITPQGPVRPLPWWKRTQIRVHL